ncbi:MAG TPA: HdeD family acid-resistance protein [Candidatus Limnocylindria bacterium]|nr:HdeD family acid-resistance protein [Candidatus Limnocylindria bacterium]
MTLRTAVVLELARGWWTFVLRGVLAIIFGIMAFAWPGPTVVVLVWLFAAWAIVDGASSLLGAFRSKQSGSRWWQVLEGLAGIVAGVIAFLWLGLAAVALVLLIAAWAIVTGIFEIVAAVRLRREISNELWLAVGGVISILFGIVLVLNPGAGLLSLAWLIGLLVIVFGVSMVLLGWRLRGVNEMAKVDAAHDYSR